MKRLRIGFLLPNYSRESTSNMPRVMRALAERGGRNSDTHLCGEP